MAQETDTATTDTRLVVKCETSFKEKCRVEAAKAGQSMSAFIRDALRASWSGTTQPNKDPDTSTYTPEPSNGFEGSDNGHVSDKSEANQTESDAVGLSETSDTETESEGAE